MYEARDGRMTAAAEERGSKDVDVAPWVACAVPEAAEVCKRSWFILVDSIEGPEASGYEPSASAAADSAFEVELS